MKTMAQQLVWLSLFAILAFTASAKKAMIPAVAEQWEPKSSGEEELSDVETFDKEFDESILSSEQRPRSTPDTQQTRKLAEQYQARQAPLSLSRSRSAGASATFEKVPSTTDLAEVNPYVKYYSYSDWYQSHSKCCPRRQNYGCSSYRRPLPCHTHYVNGRREWCCPIWPSYPSLSIANCNCNECSIFTSTCVRKGTCARRYSWRSYYAVCYRNNFWSYVTQIRRRLPTSCYCRARPQTIWPYPIDIPIRDEKLPVEPIPRPGPDCPNCQIA